VFAATDEKYAKRNVGSSLSSNEVAIIYIKSVSLSVCPGRYILNSCEQGVVFVFNVPSWTCLSVCLCGQKLGSA
jgi:hypothetical protein